MVNDKGLIIRHPSSRGKRWLAQTNCEAEASRRMWSGTSLKGCCQKAGLEHIAPHDLRRTCAKLCHTNGGEIEQIQFLLGHASVQTNGALPWLPAERRASRE
jgi:integrase